MFNIDQAAESRLPRQVVELFPAKIIVASFHVADAQLAQMLLQKRNVLEEELLLKGLGPGGYNHPLATADGRQQVS